METIFALAILILGIFSVLTMTTSSVVLSQASEQNIVVVNLAREGLELVRGVRDFSHYNEEQATASLPADVDVFFDLNGCFAVDAKNFTLRSGPNDTGLNDSDCEEGVFTCDECRLFNDVNTGRYVHGGVTGQETVFRRTVKIEPDGTGLKVLSKVSWTERGRNHEFVLEDHLTEWQ